MAKLKSIINQQTGKVFNWKGKKAKAAAMTVCYGAGIKKLTQLLGSTRRAKVLMKVAFGTHKVKHSVLSMLLS